METVDSGAEGPDFVYEDDSLDKSPRRNNSYTAYFITAPSPAFRQKTVYIYPTQLNLNKVNFDVDCKSTQANPRFGDSFHPNFRARFSIRMLLEFADFDIVEFSRARHSTGSSSGPNDCL
jgi:hypothetical protein